MAQSTCSIEECSAPHLAKGLCAKHYQRARRGGSLTDPRAHELAAAERFWPRVDKTGPCWLWTGSRNTGGYGRFAVDHDTTVVAHRFAYELLVGEVPAGLQLDHLCRVRHCVNPAHLEPVTARVNIMRGEGHAAANAAKTHCLHGHPYDEVNTYVKPDGKRVCRTCRTLQKRRARRARRGP